MRLGYFKKSKDAKDDRRKSRRKDTIEGERKEDVSVSDGWRMRASFERIIYLDKYTYMLRYAMFTHKYIIIIYNICV